MSKLTISKKKIVVMHQFRLEKHIAFKIFEDALNDERTVAAQIRYIIKKYYGEL